MAESQQSADDCVKTKNPTPIMKIEAPAEETSSTEENVDNEKNEFKICSPSAGEQTQNSNSNPFALTPSKLGKGILKPPQLSLNNQSKSFILNPSRLNPFVSNETKNEDKKNTVMNGDAPKFVPLINTENKSSKVNNTNSMMVSNSNSFVFGQNLQERVKVEGGDEAKPSTSLSSNGTSDLLFSSVVKSEVKVDSSASKEEGKSLSEYAKEYEESRANKRKYEEVEVKTGEEEETNILSISCKLFAFDKTSGSWQERGRGTLRLNDFENDSQTQSRLVFRTSGSLRVILNTKIWAEMTIEQASEKSIRLTALDSNGEVKVFLIMATIEDSKNLFQHLQSRVGKEVAEQKRKKPQIETNSGGQ